jgi:acyl-CoA hydrolase
MLFSRNGLYYKHFLEVNVAIMAVCPMDKHGYFNLSCAAGITKGVLDSADIVIVEINEHLPVIYGGFDESIHISDVDYIVEGEHPPLAQIPTAPTQPEDIRIADFILPHIVDGATLQLGIGSMPNLIGERIAQSDLKDLGMHTELCGDAYYALYKAGKLTNKRKTFQPNKAVTGMVFGTGELYEWVDHNPGFIVEPLEYVNMAEVIAKHDNMVSINNCVSVDLYGQISSETAEFRQLSGTGGQLDFLTGACMSRGGKAFICMTSTFRDKGGTLHSRIVPHFRGDIITVPRSQSYYVVTEFGCVNLTGMSTWERAELLISIAHPDFREGLIQAAEQQKIWRRTNRLRP